MIACACTRVDLLDPARTEADGHSLWGCPGQYRMPPVRVAELVDLEDRLAYSSVAPRFTDSGGCQLASPGSVLGRNDG